MDNPIPREMADDLYDWIKFVKSHVQYTHYIKAEDLDIIDECIEQYENAHKIEKDPKWEKEDQLKQLG